MEMSQLALSMRLTTVESLLTKNSHQINEVCLMLSQMRYSLIYSKKKLTSFIELGSKEQLKPSKETFRFLMTLSPMTSSKENLEIAIIFQQLQH